MPDGSDVIIFKYRGPIGVSETRGRRSVYSWEDGYSANEDDPWQSLGDCLASARAAGKRAIFERTGGAP